jgi:hydrogenase maturation factor
MCQAPVGRIIKINKDKITIECKGELKELKSKLTDVKRGDYVMFSTNIAIEKVEPEEAKVIMGEV